ncbi:MAG: DUF4292 domain-containing protein [Nitrospinaceae bacterium]
MTPSQKILFPSLARSRSLFFLLGVFGLIVSCQPMPGSVSPHLSQKTISVEYLRQFLIERQTNVSDLKSMVRTTVEGKKFRQSFRQSFFVQNADFIRIDTYSLFGQTLGVFIYDGRNTGRSKTILYDPGLNQVYRGREVGRVLWKIIGMNFDFPKYISVFFGNIPRMEFLKIQGGRLNPEKNSYLLTATDPDQNARVEIELDAYTLLPSHMERRENGKIKYTISWKDYRRVGDRDFPFKLIIGFPQHQETLTVQFTDPVLNAGLPAEAFQLLVSGKNLS